MIIPIRTILFRAAETLEEHPTPRFDPDTSKTGVYFAMNTPYLSETMSVEYNRDLIVGVYQLMKRIKVPKGKHTAWQAECDDKGLAPERGRHVAPEYNWSHIDKNMNATHHGIVDAPRESAELFLNPEDLQYVKFITSYRITVQEAVQKWERPISYYLNEQ
jgi:hypothetical protein